MSTTFTLGGWTFDHVRYDEDADVAYLSIGPPRRAVGEETPEGHIALFDEATGEFCGMTLIGIKRMIGGELTNTISLPSHQIDEEQLGGLVCA